MEGIIELYNNTFSHIQNQFSFAVNKIVFMILDYREKTYSWGKVNKKKNNVLH